MKEIKTLFEESKKALEKAGDEKKLYDVKTQYMGKKGQLLFLLKENLKKSSGEQKSKAGQLLNEVKTEFEELYLKKKTELESKDIEESLKKNPLDLSLPGPSSPQGSLHPVSQILYEIEEIFKALGYFLEEGPLVESDFYNFTALNIPPFHPSRDMQDTFYIGREHVLRTHTSPVQVRALKSRTPPFAVLAPGTVFRSDSDISHSPMFHQVEGLFVDKKVSMADLKGTLSYFLKEFFSSSKVKVRFRPSFFPFTEPSAEYDVSCPFCKEGCSVCKKSGWIEIGGCGLVHPEVFKQSGVKEDFQGFAFGLGVERLAVIRYNIPDIRLFFENDIRFLKQFSKI